MGTEKYNFHACDRVGDLWERNDDFDASKHNCFAEEDFLYDYDDDSAMVYRMLDI